MKKCIFLLVIIATVLSFFVLPSTAQAFRRRSVGRCFTSCAPVSYSYCAPVIKQAVVVQEVPVLAYPVLVPAFQFQYVPQAYAANVPVVPVTGYPLATPVVQPYGQPPVAVSQANFYGQPPQMQAYGQQPQVYGQPPPQAYGQNGYGNGNGLHNKDKIRELAKALLEEMNRLAENAPLDSGPPAIPGLAPYQQSQQQPQQQPQPPVAQQPGQQLAQVAITAMNRSCATCHTGIGSKGDVILFSQPGLLNQNVNWKKVKDAVVGQKMPPKDHHFQISPNERSAIEQWLTINGVN